MWWGEVWTGLIWLRVGISVIFGERGNVDRVLGSHSSGYEGICLLGYNTV
jgi:hypothetical protein